MQIVIDIDEYKFKEIKKHKEEIGTTLNWFEDVILNGTVLPKGHGSLIDTNEITAFRELECNGHNVESLDEFTIIIEADKES